MTDKMPSSSTRSSHDDSTAESTLSLPLLLASPTLRDNLPLLSWLVAAEERSLRHVLRTQEVEERREASDGFHHALITHLLNTRGAADKRETAAMMRPTSPLSLLERLAAVGAVDEGCEDSTPPTTTEDAAGTARSIDGQTQAERTDTLQQLLQNLEHTVARRSCFSSPLRTSRLCHSLTTHAPAEAIQHGSCVNDTKSEDRMRLDTCVAILDKVLDCRSSLFIQQQQQSSCAVHPYGDTDTHALLDASRRRHVLAVLAELRDALRSVQAAYASATHDSTPPFVSLDALLQLPPDTLPLLTTAVNSSVRELPRWCTLFASVSLYTLWTALIDGAEMYAVLRRQVVDALWAAVLWMHANAPPPSSPRTAQPEKPLHRPPPPSLERSSRLGISLDEVKSSRTPQKSRVASPRFSPPRTPNHSSLFHHSSSVNVMYSSPRRQPLHVAAEGEEERWAYRELPVRRAYTAPTAYDALFPLPSATSAFTQPGPLSRRGHEGEQARSVRRAWEEDDDDGSAPWRNFGVDFYTGPSRRPQPLS